MALSRFVAKWQHAYQGGTKGPKLLAINATLPSPEECGEVGTHPVQPAHQLKLLGHWIDEGLTFRQQTQVVVHKLKAAGREVTSTMCDAGFGLPFMAAQFSSRIENKALAGVEILASAQGGFRRVMHQLNETQIEVAKNFLGLAAGV